MISLLLSSAIASLLVIGCYYDWKTRHVSNLITGAVILLSLPLVYLNLSYGEYNPLLYGAGLIAMAFVMGMADVKVLIPIFFSYTSLNLLLFLLIFGIIGFAYILITKKKNDVPVFIPITVGYVVVMLFA